MFRKQESVLEEMLYETPWDLP